MKTGYSPLNSENNRGVINVVMFAYVHEKINILLSVLIFFSFSFISILTWVHNLLSINFASIETCKFSRNAMQAYLLYSCVIYTDMSMLSSYIEINLISFRC